MKQADEILKQELQELSFDEEVKEIFISNGHTNLQSVLAVPVKEWMGYEDMNYHRLQEIIKFLVANNLQGLLSH